MPINKARNRFKENFAYETPIFTTEEISEKFSRVLTDESYKIKMKKV